eukprot:6187331-Pleurochrysis_carterae.AAC.2
MQRCRVTTNRGCAFGRRRERRARSASSVTSAGVRMKPRSRECTEGSCISELERRARTAGIMRECDGGCGVRGCDVRNVGVEPEGGVLGV